MDRLTHALLSPLFHVLSNLAFTVTGPSIASARLISAVAGAASPVLFFVLIRRITQRRDLAICGALLFSVSEWAAFQSRAALIESLQLALILLTVVLLTFDGWRMAALAGLACSLVFLTKVNALFVLAPCTVLIVERARGIAAAAESELSWKSVIVRSVIFVGTSLGVAGLVYALLYFRWPLEFTRAFRFELDGKHFEALSHPLIRVGRFGLDPVFAGRTVLSLFREEPFLLVLASLGVILAASVRQRGSLFFAAWLLIGGAYFLTQMFQPIRYFYLILPAVLFFAVVAIDSISSQKPALTGWSIRPRTMAMSVIMLFELAYFAANGVANRAAGYANVVRWMQENTQPADRVLASALLSTDLKNRSYQFYRLVAPPADLTTATQDYHIRYVVVDTSEWPLALRSEVAHRFRLVRQWPNAAVYEVPSLSAACCAEAR